MGLLSSLKAGRLVNKVLEAKNDDGWREPLRELKGMGADAKGVFPRLLEAATRNPDSELRYRSLVALRELGTKDVEASSILACLQDQDGLVRCAALWALKDYGRNPEAVVPALVKALSDTDRSVRRSAAEALTGYARFAKQAVPRLAELVREPETSIPAADALTAIGAGGLDEETCFFHVLVSGISQGATGVEKAVQMGPHFVPPLEAFLVASDPLQKRGALSQRAELFLHALTVYEKHGGVPGEALRRVLQKLTDWQYDRQSDAGHLEKAKKTADWLLRRHPVSDEAELARSILQGGPAVRSDAIARSRKIEAKSPEIIAALCAGAKDWSSLPCMKEAITYLEQLGPLAQEALPTLRGVAAAAGRPVTPDDFREQRELLGGLSESTWRRIDQREPLAPEILEIANRAIQAIETKDSA